MKRQLILASVAAFFFGLSPSVFAKNLSVSPAQPGKETATGSQPGSAQSNTGQSVKGKKGAYGAAQTDETSGGPSTEGEQTTKKHTTKHKAKHHVRHTR